MLKPTRSCRKPWYFVAIRKVPWLPANYARQGRAKEAKHYVDELLRQIPRYSLRALRKNPMFVDPKMADDLIECMRLAGLPD